MEDYDVIVAVLDGDIDQFKVLVERHYRGLYNHLAVILKDHAWADDIAQNTFIKAYNGLSKYNSAYHFSTWLYRIGTNAALNELRPQRAIGLDDIPELVNQSDPDRWAQVEKREADVRTAVARLPLNYRTVISLHYWQGQSYEDIASTLNIPLGTVKTWLYRAKKQLKGILEPNLWTD